MSGAARQSARILMTLDAVGGVWRYAMDLAGALKGQGTATVFVGLGPGPAAAERRQAQALGELVWLDQPLDWMVDSADALSQVGPTLSLLAEAYDVDLLHLNLPTQAVGLETGRPVLVVSHSCVTTWFAAVRGSGLPPGWGWQAERNREGLLRADAVAAPSHAHAKALARAYGDGICVDVVENATLLQETMLPKEPRIFAAGRWWDEGKNGAMLDRAAALAEWPVEMAGPLVGPHGQALALSHARALGSLPHAAAMARLTSAAIVASPSLYEPFGLAALEGARAGAALVLADIPTYRELWEGAALFAAPDDATAFADCLNRLAADADLRRALGAAAQARARRFTPQAQGQAMSALYGRLLDGTEGDRRRPAGTASAGLSSHITAAE
ncbi:glycosyl transferase [Rhizobium rhizosphaerae]|uniref:Glycosyl transferase n=1 Tax=Xaviernesmea rhizosphaerae TaxID=1672749 RepID=A0A1Q9AFB9_9HYPH|nr:glycosyltransferase family 4 protein [Xaviernesmea rhizosphaerae]OLP53659.1 glycosyl transferase [Xaviernesmea rhizosphaerae]